MTVYTLFLMLGGMCVPYVWGAVFLHEQLTAFRIIGLVVIAAALILMNLSERPPKKQILMCVAVFFLNGLCSVISKEHQISANEMVSASGFVMLTGAATAFFGLVGIIAERMKGHGAEPVYGGRGNRICFRFCMTEKAFGLAKSKKRLAKMKMKSLPSWHYRMD